MFKRAIQTALFLTLLVPCLLFGYPVKQEVKNILVIHSYHQNYPWTKAVNKGLHERFNEHGGTNLFFEYLDAKRSNIDSTKTSFTEVLQQKYPDIDSIVAVDGPAFSYIRDTRDYLFGDIPVFYGGINIRLRPKGAFRLVDQRYIGILIKPSIEENIDLIMRMHPNTRSIISIINRNDLDSCDASDKAIGYIRTHYQGVKAYKLPNKNRRELVEGLSKLHARDNPVLFHISCFSDHTGLDRSLDDALSAIREYSNFPVYTIWKCMATKGGIIGGFVLDGEDTGRQLGEMVVTYFEFGSMTGMEPIIHPDNKPVFDYIELERFRIPQNRVPVGSEIFNKPLSYVKKYQETLVIMMVFFGIETIIVIFLIINIYRRKRAQRQLKVSETKYRNLVECLQEHYFIYTRDRKGRVNYISPSVTTILGKPQEEFMDKRIWDCCLTSCPSNLAIEQHISRVTGGLKTPPYEMELYHENGTKKQFEVIEVPIIGSSAVAVEGFARDITDNKEREQRINRLAYYDDLTELPNRALGTDRIIKAISHHRRLHGSFGLLFIDLDNFKIVNDTLGHDKGDELLVIVGRRLQDVVRDSDTVSRFGGDEFVILSEELESEEAAGLIADKIIKRVGEPINLTGSRDPIYITTSIGIAIYPEDGNSLNSLIKNADSAMYQAKEKGKGKYMFFSPEINQKNIARLALESNIHKGLEKNEFVPYFQPQIDLNTGEVVGLETLVRWAHDGRVISPGEFIPIAEKSGLINRIGGLVLDKACFYARKWCDMGVPIRVAVNVSIKQLMMDGFVSEILTILKDHGLTPGTLEIEITESIFLEDNAPNADKIRALRAQGVLMSIDDFGTGYSSMAYLRQFPVDKLKIDSSFVSKIMENTEDASIVEAIINIGHILDMSVISEGVETEEQAKYLTELGCDEAQGYLYSKPMSVEDTTEYLRRMNKNGKVQAFM